MFDWSVIFEALLAVTTCWLFAASAVASTSEGSAILLKGSSTTFSTWGLPKKDDVEPKRPPSTTPAPAKRHKMPAGVLSFIYRVEQGMEMRFAELLKLLEPSLE